MFGTILFMFVQIKPNQIEPSYFNVQLLDFLLSTV